MALGRKGIIQLLAKNDRVEISWFVVLIKIGKASRTIAGSGGRVANHESRGFQGKKAKQGSQEKLLSRGHRAKWESAAQERKSKFENQSLSEGEGPALPECSKGVSKM